MANPPQFYKAKALKEALKPFEKNRRLICIRNINYSSDARQFEEACRKLLTIADDVKFLGKVYLGFDTRPDYIIALQQISEGFDFEGLKVVVERSGKGPNPKNQVASTPASSIAASASTPALAPAPAPAPAPDTATALSLALSLVSALAPVPAPALAPAPVPALALSPAAAPSENQPEAQMVAPTERLSVETIISYIDELATAPLPLLARAGEHARVSELVASLAAAFPETVKCLVEAPCFQSESAATGSASGSSTVPVSGAGPIEEPTTNATSCNNTVQTETAAAQSGDITMQSDKDGAESEGGWWW
ncbi:unnamed protein product [Clonostachys rhizophaga]|uniref:RRM domain-containing protein n=1 Tax=Clonostachys rhizophaga TaxID=160324 RepID=A0A9N9VSW7_9HYPO|nr:unnamed protein product [Clonostachys rhizophaga]